MTMCILIPYIGIFPNYFQLFLNSCRYNKNYHWIILTDNQEKYDYPCNVKKIDMNFEQIRELIQSKFDFKISLETPHKLCEYKPAYGYIFDQYIMEYDFWGYGDLDVIYGDLDFFITDEMLSYRKIFTKGHLSFIKNTLENNKMFMKEINGVEVYKKAFTSEKNFNFDEDFINKTNINMIFRNADSGVWESGKIADIYVKSNDFKLTWEINGRQIIEKKMPSLFIWNRGVLIRYQREHKYIRETKFMYIHLQKRKMKVLINGVNPKQYKIIPNAFDKIKVKSKRYIFKEKLKYRNLQYFRIRSNNLLIKIKNIVYREKIKEY